MAYRQVGGRDSFAERNLDELIITDVGVEPLDAGRYRLSVAMRTNADAMAERFGILLSLFLKLFVMRRATSEFSGQILVDAPRLLLLREQGFPKLTWSELELPRQGVLIVQSYRAALASSRDKKNENKPPQEFELVRVAAAPLHLPAGQTDVEELAMAELADQARELHGRVWIGEQPPLPAEWTAIFSGLGYRVAKSIAESLADALHYRVFDVAHLRGR